MTLLADWSLYLENPDRFDKYHFEGLMLELDTPDLVHQALDPLPNGAPVAERIIDFRRRADFNGTYILPPTREGDLVVARRLAEDYRDRVADRLFELNDASAALVRRNPIVESTYEEHRALVAAHRSATDKIPGIELLRVTEILGNDYLDYAQTFPDWRRGLEEAVYMMTTFPEITRYFLWPMIKYPLDETPAAELWLMGHRVDFCEDRTLLIIGGAG